jgi:hypothetical protein
MDSEVKCERVANQLGKREEEDEVEKIAVCSLTKRIEALEVAEMERLKVGKTEDVNMKEDIVMCACIMEGMDGRLPLANGQIYGSNIKVLRDTGCSGAVLNKKYCPSSNLTGKYSNVHQIHGNSIKAPLAEVEVDTPYYKGKLKVAVLDNPISDLILGNVRGGKFHCEIQSKCEGIKKPNEDGQISVEIEKTRQRRSAKDGKTKNSGQVHDAGLVEDTCGDTLQNNAEAFNELAYIIDKSENRVVMYFMPHTVSYKDIRKFFAGCEIPYDGINLLNNRKGKRNGMGYVRFATIKNYEEALEKDGKKMNGRAVRFGPCFERMKIIDDGPEALKERKVETAEVNGDKEEQIVEQCCASRCLKVPRANLPNINKEELVELQSSD